MRFRFAQGDRLVLVFPAPRENLARSSRALPPQQQKLYRTRIDLWDWSLCEIFVSFVGFQTDSPSSPVP
jgi:hypothetical protein